MSNSIVPLLCCLLFACGGVSFPDVPADAGATDAAPDADAGYPPNPGDPYAYACCDFARDGVPEAIPCCEQWRAEHNGQDSLYPWVPPDASR